MTQKSPSVLPSKSTSPQPPFTLAERIALTVLGAFLALILIMAISWRMNGQAEWLPDCPADAGPGTTSFLASGSTAWDVATRIAGNDHDARPLADKITALDQASASHIGGNEHLVPCQQKK